MEISCINQQGMSLVSISLAGVSLATVITSYAIAVARNDVASIFPYISDTGGKPPESCIFGQLLNITALIILVSAWIRFKQIEDLKERVTGSLGIWNKIALVVAIGSGFGLSVVANFQNTAVYVVHMIGAVFAFIGGMLYAAIQTWISYKIYPQWNSLGVCRFRLSLTVFGIAMVITTYLSEIVSVQKWNQHHIHNDTFQWSKEDNGYAAHIVSTFGEWFLAASILVFFVSYYSDFKKVTLDLEMKRTLDVMDLPNTSYEDQNYDVEPLKI